MHGNDLTGWYARPRFSRSVDRSTDAYPVQVSVRPHSPAFRSLGSVQTTPRKAGCPEVPRREPRATICQAGPAPIPHGARSKIEQDPRSVPKTVALRGPGRYLKGAVSRRKCVVRAQFIHLPKLDAARGDPRPGSCPVITSAVHSCMVRPGAPLRISPHLPATRPDAIRNEKVRGGGLHEFIRGQCPVLPSSISGSFPGSSVRFIAWWGRIRAGHR